MRLEDREEKDSMFRTFYYSQEPTWEVFVEEASNNFGSWIRHVGEFII
jgi:hypothetical protein